MRQQRHRMIAQDLKKCPTGFVVLLFNSPKDKEHSGLLAKSSSRFGLEAQDATDAQIFQSEERAEKSAKGRTDNWFKVVGVEQFFARVYDVYEPGYRCERGGNQKVFRIREFWVDKDNVDRYSKTPELAIKKLLKETAADIKGCYREIETHEKKKDTIRRVFKDKLKAGK